MEILSTVVTCEPLIASKEESEISPSATWWILRSLPTLPTEIAPASALELSPNTTALETSPPTTEEPNT